VSHFRVPVGILLLALVLTTACGKRGNPLPPLQRTPGAPGDFSIARFDDNVFVRMIAPTTNVDGAGPADVARVELYAITAPRVPTFDEPEELRTRATLVGSQVVRRPLPPPPPVKEGLPPIPLPPPGPGVDQGEVIALREVLSAETRAAVMLPEPPGTRAASLEAALIAPADGGAPQRYYYAVSVSPRGRYGPPTALVAVPLGPTSSAPSQPMITVEEQSATIRWKPSGDVRGAAAPTPEGLLASRPILPGPPPTTYDVYEVPREQPANPPPHAPTPLTKAPVGGLEFVQSGITLGTERCYVVRPVDILAGTHVRGPASPVTCASFADTFAPVPPGTLQAVAVSGRINLIWLPSAAGDVVGYVVLRGEGPDATLTPLMKQPIAGTTYADESVRPGVAYVYAVVAVDKAGNASTLSNRVEETARQ
jgi:hypothetical protein